MARGAAAGRRADVAACVRAAIAELDSRAELRDLLTRLVARPGRVLCPDRPAEWPRFVVRTCECLGGDRAAAAWPAASVELAVAAADVVDDLADGEWDDRLGDVQRAPNASFALTWLAERCARRAEPDLGTGRASLVSQLLGDGFLEACIGEDLDVLLERDPAASEELAHEMTRRKSGSLISMAFKVGAACASDDPQVIEAAGLFGAHAGAVAQLLNDIAGIDPTSPRRSTDIARRKKTLPVAYALRAAREEGISLLLDWYAPEPLVASPTEEEVAAAIANLGGLHFAWVVADAQRKEALTALGALAELTGRGEVRRLAGLIPSLRPRRST